MCQTTNISLVGPAAGLLRLLGCPRPARPSRRAGAFSAPPRLPGEAFNRPGASWSRVPGHLALQGHEGGQGGKGNGAGRRQVFHGPRKADHAQCLTSPGGPAAPAAPGRASPRPRPPPAPLGSPTSTGELQLGTRRTRGRECACAPSPAQPRLRLATGGGAPSVGHTRDSGSVYKGAQHAIPNGCPFPDRTHPVEKESCPTS